MAQKKPTEQQQEAYKEYKRLEYVERRREIYMRMSLQELQDRCRRASLPEVGTKAVLVEALQAEKRMHVEARKAAMEALQPKEGVGKSEDAEEASSNMTEHLAAEWLEQLEEIDPEVQLMLDREAMELRSQQYHEVKSEVLEQLQEQLIQTRSVEPDEEQLRLDREALELRSQQYDEVKQLEVMEGQETQQLQDEVELLLQH